MSTIECRKRAVEALASAAGLSVSEYLTREAEKSNGLWRRRSLWNGQEARGWAASRRHLQEQFAAHGMKLPSVGGGTRETAALGGPNSEGRLGVDGRREPIATPKHLRRSGNTPRLADAKAKLQQVKAESRQKALVKNTPFLMRAEAAKADVQEMNERARVDGVLDATRRFLNRSKASKIRDRAKDLSKKYGRKK